MDGGRRDRRGPAHGRRGGDSAVNAIRAALPTPGEDDLPIVLVEDDDPIGADAPPSAEGLALLRRVAEICQAGLPGHAEATAYLRSAGAGDPALWAAYRLGVGDHALYRDLVEGDRRLMRSLGLLAARGGNREILTGSGCCIFTVDPLNPDQPVGVVRLRKAQNTHVFATAPAGLGCAPDVGDHDRLVLVDNPLLMLRLAAAGVRGVALVEHPAVLPPLAEWLRDRELFAASYRHPSLTTLVDALAGHGLPAQGLVVAQILERSDARTLDVLGLDREDLKAAGEAQPALTPVLIHELHAYACARVRDGAATEALLRSDLHQGDLVQRLRMGYLPPDYQEALSRTARRAIQGRRLGGCVVVPAVDEEGAIVDLLAFHPTTRRYGGLWPEARGMIGGDLRSWPDEVIATDNLPWLGRLAAQGYRDMVVLRDPPDAARNARRLVDGGVRAVRVRSYRDGEAIAAALRAAGLLATVEAGLVTGEDWLATAPETITPVAVEPAPTVDSEPACAPTADRGRRANADAPSPSDPTPSPQSPDLIAADPDPQALRLVDFDEDQDVALFEVGPLRYAIEIADGENPTRQVVARRGQGCHQDRINLDLEPQRRRFAGSAARRLSADSQRVEDHLVTAWRLLCEREAEAASTPAVAVTGDERARAEALLRAPDLLERIGQDLADLGWAGEDRTRLLLYMTAVSRLLPDPGWSVYRATTGAAPWKSLGIIAALVPPEDRVVFHRLTEAVLKATDPRALRHRLVLVDRAETLRPEGAIALRCLREWGGIGWQQVVQAEGASMPGILGEARGPVAVLAAAAGDLDHRCRDCFLTITVDDTPEQTARVLEAQRRQTALGTIAASQAEAIIRRHHALQRLLRPAPVAIPFVDRIAFPQTSLRHRDEQAAFLRLIAASAILHQHQRGRDAAGAVLADEADFHHAHAVAGHLLGQGGDGLSRYGRHLFQRLVATGTREFVLSDLGGLVGDWTHYTFRAAAEELVAMGFCSAQGGGQGRARRYTLLARPVAGTPGIALLPADQGMDRTEPRDLAKPRDGESRGPNPVALVG